MLANTRPGLLTLYPQIGRSYFGRPIFAVAITGNNSPTPSETTNKPTIYIQCLIHAREWISGAMCPYIADVLTASYGSDPRITSIMDRARIAMVPIVNPDGYAYTFTTDRMFRKNMRAVDLNRNHVFMWGRIGASANPRDETYRGPGPASEPETQTIVSFQSNQPTRIIGALDFHSYGQDILRPFGHTSQPAPDEARLAAVSNRMANAIRRVRGNVYKSAPSGIGLYWTSGTADDDFYVRLKAYSLTVELSPPDSDSGNLGFIISPRWIRSVGNDMIPAVLEFAEFTLANPLN
ncbi:Zn-dependent exopeptidase [Ramicandelaber brevisporus]|nr:Zn-dependent exopeptidase [Ramicandelaber brevisporus]